MTDTTTISTAELNKMKRDLAKLYALEAGGVDNWEWFDESLKGWRKENAMSEMIDDLVSDFSETVDEIAIDADVDFPGGYECGASVSMRPCGDKAKDFIIRVIEKYKELEADQRDA